MTPQPGDKYIAKSEGAFVKNCDSIDASSEWIVSCTNGGKVSLECCGKNRNLWPKITISKAFFGQNFEKYRWSTLFG